MTYFILTDSDWNWDTDETPPMIVEADDEQEAAKMACHRMQDDGYAFDGGQFKLARLRTHAFVSFEKCDDGTIEVEPALFVHSAPEGALYRTTIWARPIGSDSAWQWAADTGGTAQNVADCLLSCARMWDGHEFAMTPFLAASEAHIRAEQAPCIQKADAT